MRIDSLKKLKRQIGAGPWPITEVPTKGQIYYLLDTPIEQIVIKDLRLAKFLSGCSDFINSEILLDKQSLR